MADRPRDLALERTVRTPGVGRTVGNWGEIMPDKSPHDHHVKKPATKTLKEKRAEKHAKEHEHDMSAASDAVQEAHKKADQAHKKH
ncbi:hypothetical protein JOE59_002478 [Agromyces cerinus]|uniref:hypothetical protein n=2 Tax=Agromyces cerinus TaxID=33878 RepID=UPI00195C2AAD|nr:hypothetical protein [Agromyces cerinus]MBM7831773.1 hypothetical protein [Agromyces cerinus]